MKKYSLNEDFEKAAVLKNKLNQFEYITQSITPVEKYLRNPNLLYDLRKKEINQLEIILNKYYTSKKQINNIKHIECYDVSHLSGSYPAASMVTFINGNPYKSLYRHFKIRQAKTLSDFDSMKEVAKRRSKYFKKWGKPDLILVDGGKSQVSAFLSMLSKYNIPIIGTAKKSESLVIPFPKIKSKYIFKKYKLTNGPALNLIKRLRNEAHRFARRYHHTLVKKQLFS